MVSCPYDTTWRYRRVLRQYWPGVGVDTAVIELQSRQFKLHMLLFILNWYPSSAPTIPTPGQHVLSAYAIEDGGFAEEVPPKSLLLCPDCNFGAASIHNVGCWVGELGRQPGCDEDEA